MPIASQVIESGSASGARSKDVDMEEERYIQSAYEPALVNCCCRVSAEGIRSCLFFSEPPHSSSIFESIARPVPASNAL